MALTYDILKVLKPTHFNSAKSIIVKVPVQLVERHSHIGVESTHEIDLSDTPCKVVAMDKVHAVIERMMNLIPGLYFNHFEFMFVGGFSERNYV